MPVSADSMIENILGTKDMPKPKSPPAPPKKVSEPGRVLAVMRNGNEGENKS